MLYRRANFPSAHFLGYLLLTSTLLLGFIDSVIGKAIPLPFPFPADNSPPDTSYNPPAPAGALPIPANPLNINKDWFLSYLTKDQPENNCVFYCRITTGARDWIKLNPPLRTIWETYPKFLFTDKEEPRKSFIDADTEAETQSGEKVYVNKNRYAAMSSEAYAERCLGTTVYLLLDESIGIPEQCIWNSEEKKALQREPNPIQKVIEITFEVGTIIEKSRREYALAEDEPASPSSSPTGEPCAANPGPNGKRDLSCLASFSSTISTITPVGTSAKARPPCVYSVGEKGDSCICSDTITLPPAASTGTNTGEQYNPCPMTALPPTPTSMSSSATPRNTPQFAFTTTNLLNHDVVACESTSLAYYVGTTQTYCAGSSVTLTFAPSATVQVGKKQQNVGTLNGTALYTSISSALDKICPTATGNWASCATTTVAIKQIVYIADDTTRGEDGELVVSVQSSSYNDTKLRDAMIRSAALTAQTSANKTNCYETKYTECFEGKGGGECAEEKITLCNAAGFAGVQYYDGAPVSATMWLDALWEFGVYSGGAFDCEVIIETLDTLLVEVAPEFAVEDVALGEDLQAACQDTMNH